MADNIPLREAFNFDDSDLKQNHLGRISQKQLQRLKWRRFFPQNWWVHWASTIWSGFLILVLGRAAFSISFNVRSHFLFFTLLAFLIFNFRERFAIRFLRDHQRDINQERAECLYGRVLHLPDNNVLVGQRKLMTLSHKQQQAFEHNAYYTVYVAPHSGEILSAEIADKPKY